MPRSRSRSPTPRHRSDKEKDRRRDDPTTRSSKRRSRSPDDRESRKKRRNDDNRQRTSRDRSVSPGKDKKCVVYGGFFPWEIYKCYSRRKKDKEARRAEKQRQREDEEARQIAELSVYSAADNPFHDVNLGQQFKWHKKAEKEKKAGLSAAEAARKDELRRIEARVC
jgi:cactin